MVVIYPRIVESAFNALCTPGLVVEFIVHKFVHYVRWILAAVRAESAVTAVDDFVGRLDRIMVNSDEPGR